MMGLRHGRAAAAMMRYLRGVAAALVLALGVGFVVGTVAPRARRVAPGRVCAGGYPGEPARPGQLVPAL